MHMVCAVLLVMSGLPEQGMALPLPEAIAGWKRDAQVQTYDADTIFDYIDGIGEIYRAYNMQRVWVYRYRREGYPSLTVDLFEMGTPDDAFGVFTFERDGEAVGVGQGSDYAAGMLRFWKERYFVVVSAEQETEEVRQAVIRLGRAIARAIPRIAPLPSLLRALPSVGRQRGDVLFFRHPMILNRHFFVAEKDILNLNPKVEGVLAVYRAGKAKVRLVVLRYPSEAEALAAWDTFGAAYLREGRQSGIVRTENRKWTAAQRAGRLLAIVFDAPTQKEAEEMLRSVRIQEVLP
ncbi:MAG: DUF6599 family protein [Armatimonadota bacterium]|nr:DUF6599 family protein [Armatimonadota bacterium]